MIGITGLHYRTLDIERLAIPRGVTSVIGRNGSGKTTLLRLCSGIAEPEKGSILYDGRTPRMVEIGWLNEFPDRNLLFHSVSSEIASALRFRREPEETIRSRVEQAAAALGIAHLLERESCSLSGGERLLVAVAAAIVAAPEVLVLDEYDSHLDTAWCGRIDSLLRQSPVPYVIRCTQDMETAAESDFVIVLERGRVLHAGKPEEVFPHFSGTPWFPLSWRCRA